MPIPYEKRRQRRLQLAESLPPELRGRIALRNVEAVAKFPPEAQQRLAAAMDLGVRITAAIALVKKNPGATVEEIVQAAGRRTPRRKPTAAADCRGGALLADLLQSCYPDMPRATAEAMAGCELLSEVLAVVQAQQVCFESAHAQSEFVLVILCGLALKNMKDLQGRVQKRPIYRQALQKSGVVWPFL